jgi:probable phosphoglycerate mutase
MATTILLARHGETDWNRDHRWQGQADPPLNDAGRAQSHALARALAAEPPAAIYSSDLSRARETAEIVAATFAVPLALDPRLREVDVGEWSGLTMAEVERFFPHGAQDRREGGTGWRRGERYEAMSERVLEAVYAIAAAHRGARILAVTHGGPMRSVWVASGEEPSARPPYGNCVVEQFMVEPGRIARINSMESGGLHKQVQRSRNHAG